MPDLELIREIARGSSPALGKLYDRHASLLLRVLTRILGNPQEAEDILHEVFLEAWERAADYDPERGSVRAWLVMRARSRGLDRLRALGRARAAPLLTPLNDEPGQSAPDVISLRRALQKLTPDLKTLLVLGYFEGMSSAEIAEHERLAIGTVKSRVARALAELRDVLGQS